MGETFVNLAVLCQSAKFEGMKNNQHKFSLRIFFLPICEFSPLKDSHYAVKQLHVVHPIRSVDGLKLQMYM